MNEHPPAHAVITRQAVHWHALQREGELDTAQRTAFMDWLVASPRHLREYLAVGRATSDLTELLREEDIDLDALLAAPAPDDTVVPMPLPVRASTSRTSRWPSIRHMVLAASLAFMMLVAWQVWPDTRHYATAKGQPIEVELADHSVMHLNGDSEVDVHLGWLVRRIDLRRGQASFVVAADRRPMEVFAGDLRVRDIGTTFDVDLLSGHARVGVSEGRVQVSSHGTVLANLHAGQSARIAFGDHRVNVRRDDSATITAWWQGRLVFRNQSLGEVAQRFNRINAMQLNVDDHAAASMQLTGNLRGNDLHALRAFLEQQPSLHVHEVGNALHVGTR